MTVSRINVNISLISINSIGLYLAIEQAGTENREIPTVLSYVQMLGVFVILFCVFVEFSLLVLYLLREAVRLGKKACSRSKKVADSKNSDKKKNLASL